MQVALYEQNMTSSEGKVKKLIWKALFKNWNSYCIANMVTQNVNQDLIELKMNNKKEKMVETITRQ